MSALVIVDVGLGNVASVRNMLARLGHDVEMRAEPHGLGATDRYILPGVGSFDEGIRRLQRTGWFDHLGALPQSTEILGICLGMQLLGRGSEEGTLAGLGRIPTDFVRFAGVPRVPHMGWNAVRAVGEDRIFDPEMTERRYYFTHSYHANCDPEVQIGLTDYGGAFVSAYRVGATRGVQFHPEKSHKFGLSLLSRWLMSTPC